MAKKKAAKKKVPKKTNAKQDVVEKGVKKNSSEEASGVPSDSPTSFFEEESMSPFQAYDGGSSASRSGSRATGLKRALCIGINDYPDPRDRLYGCVNDANSWASWFAGQGFDVTTLIDSQATGSCITETIEHLIQESQPGEVVAIQYSGHGTQLPDLEGEEADRKDEALVPYDHRQNGYILDDDLAELCDQIRTGVNVTFFMDCCHSGTITRLFVGPGVRSNDVRVRFLAPDEEMLAAHRNSRRRGNSGRSARSVYRGHKEILMSACRAEETAKERNGQGDFTRYALAELERGVAGITNVEFIKAVFDHGVWDRQKPQLWSDPKFFHQPLLGARQRGASGGQPLAFGQSDAGEVSRTLADLEAGIGRLRDQLLG